MRCPGVWSGRNASRNSVRLANFGYIPYLPTGPRQIVPKTQKGNDVVYLQEYIRYGVIPTASFGGATIASLVTYIDFRKTLIVDRPRPHAAQHIEYTT